MVRGALRAEMAAVIPVSQRLKRELPAMFSEHRQIVAALETLAEAARAAGLREHERFALTMIRHAEIEELVFYPAAILLGEHLERLFAEESIA